MEYHDDNDEDDDEVIMDASNTIINMKSTNGEKFGKGSDDSDDSDNNSNANKNENGPPNFAVIKCIIP